MIHSPAYDPEALDVEIGYLLTRKAPQAVRLTEDSLLTQRELPGVETMATLIHVGHVDARHQAMGAFGNWIEQNGWRLIDVGREILMSLPIEGRDDQSVIEIQLPVSRTGKQLGA